jgi:hypothetical protein
MTDLIADSEAPRHAALNEIRGCEVCGGERLESVLDLGQHPMCDDLVPIGDSRICREYPIEILFCDACRTAHQRFQVPKQDLFPSTYHYRSRFTADVLAGMQNLVKSCEERVGDLSGREVLDIGCNDGSLLDFFHQRGAATAGIEPTGAVEDAAVKGHRTLRAFLSAGVARALVAAHGQPDIVTFTNVFAHIENLSEVLGALKILMGPRTLLVIENHYLGAVLAGNQFDTFYHEHPRTYSCTSFAFVARSLGIEVLDVEFPSRYGGNIRVFLGSPFLAGSDRRSQGDILEGEKQLRQRFDLLNWNIARWRSTKRQALDDLIRRHDSLPAKAFPGRAAILIKLLGIDERHISAIYEKPGSMKIGHYAPGTRIPIRSDDELLALRDKSLPILNLAWHIAHEIREYLARRGYAGPVVDILGAEDFATAG